MLGRNEAIQSVTDKLQAFQLNIELWRNKIHESLRQMCHLTAAALSENDQLMSLKKTISNHLAIFQQVFFTFQTSIFPARLDKKFLYLICGKGCQRLGIVSSRTTVGIKHESYLTAETQQNGH